MAANAPFNKEVTRVDRSALSPKEISLIRDTWGLARRDADLAPKVFLRHFELHPETQKMFPRFADVPKDQLLSNKYFLQAAYNCFFGLTVIIKNIDEMNIVDHLLVKHASSSFYVAGPSAKEQLDVGFIYIDLFITIDVQLILILCIHRRRLELLFRY